MRNYKRRVHLETNIHISKRHRLPPKPHKRRLQDSTDLRPQKSRNSLMVAAATSIKISPQTFMDRVKKHKDGSVLLSVENNRICRLNGVGALTWMILEEAKTDLSLNEVVLRLQQQF